MNLEQVGVIQNKLKLKYSVKCIIKYKHDYIIMFALHHTILLLT